MEDDSLHLAIRIPAKSIQQGSRLYVYTKSRCNSVLLLYLRKYFIVYHCVGGEQHQDRL